MHCSEHISAMKDLILPHASIYNLRCHFSYFDIPAAAKRNPKKSCLLANTTAVLLSNREGNAEKFG
jgi:hypothetical protein